MKKLFKSVALATVASSALLSGSALAADQKIAVVNFKEVMATIPQADDIRQKLEEEFKDARSELEQLQKDIKYFNEKKKRDAAIMSKKEVEDLDKKIAEAYQTFQTKGQALQQKAGARQNEETNKLIALIRQAVDGIAAKEKYDLVLEQSSVLYTKPDAVITSKVVEQVSKLK